MSFLKKLNLELKPCLCIPVGENLLPCFPEDFPGGASGKESTCQCRTHKSCGFDPWVGKIPWRKAWQPTLVFLPGESLGQMSLVGYSPWGCKDGVAKSWTWLKWLSRHTCFQSEAKNFKVGEPFSSSGPKNPKLVQPLQATREFQEEKTCNPCKLWLE